MWFRLFTSAESVYFYNDFSFVLGLDDGSEQRKLRERWR
jgi:hypothetical protein